MHASVANMTRRLLEKSEQCTGASELKVVGPISGYTESSDGENEHQPNRREMIFGALATVGLGYGKLENKMTNKLTLVVRFRIPQTQKQEFLTRLREVFKHIVEEPTFVEASLVEDMRDPESILNYEVWDETPESFMKAQMSKSYRAAFEKMIVDLKVERTPAWYSTIEDWKRA